MLPVSTSSSLKRDTQFGASMNLYNSQGTINERKLSHVIATSKNETLTDVECKSESKPIFFKPIVNKLRFQRIRGIETTSQRSRLEIEHRSGSEVLSLQSENKSRSKSKRFTKRDNLHIPQVWNSLYVPFIPYEIPLNHNFRDIIKQNVLLPYVTSSHDIYINPRENFKQRNSINSGNTTSMPYFQNAYFFIRSNSFQEPKIKNQKDFPITIVNTIGETNEDFESSQLNKVSNESVLVRAANFSNQIETLPNVDTPVTSKIILKPLAKAKAGTNGVAISSPLSTAYVKRGDYVEIEYLPEAIADVGEGGVAISRPELVIHFVDRRRK